MFIIKIAMSHTSVDAGAMEFLFSMLPPIFLRTPKIKFWIDNSGCCKGCKTSRICAFCRSRTMKDEIAGIARVQTEKPEDIGKGGVLQSIGAPMCKQCALRMAVEDRLLTEDAFWWNIPTEKRHRAEYKVRVAM